MKPFSLPSRILFAALGFLHLLWQAIFKPLLPYIVAVALQRLVDLIFAPTGGFPPGVRGSTFGFWRSKPPAKKGDTPR